MFKKIKNYDNCWKLVLIPLKIYKEDFTMANKCLVSSNINTKCKKEWVRKFKYFQNHLANPLIWFL